MRTIRYVRNDGTPVTVTAGDRAIRHHLAQLRYDESGRVVTEKPLIAPTKNVRNDQNSWEHSDHVEEPLIAPTMNFGEDQTAWWEPQTKHLVTQHGHEQEPLIALVMSFEDRSPEVTNRKGTKPQRDQRRTSHEEDGKETPLICPEMVF